MLSFLTLLVALEAGYMPDYNIAMNDEQYMHKMLYADFFVEVEAFDLVFASYGNKVMTTHLEWVTVVPQTQTYTYAFGIRQGGMEFGLRHLCTHPTESLLVDGIRSDLRLFQWQNEIYVRYAVKFGPDGIESTGR